MILRGRKSFWILRALTYLNNNYARRTGLRSISEKKKKKTDYNDEYESYEMTVITNEIGTYGKFLNPNTYTY